MKGRMNWLVGAFLCTCFSYAAPYAYLDRVEERVFWPTPEVANPSGRYKPIEVDLKNYFSEFNQDKKIALYVSIGAMMGFTTVPSKMAEQLRLINSNEKLGLENIEVGTDGKLRFHEPKKKLTYELEFGHERNDYIRALANKEVVLYLGHARDGRGPAFEEMQNYFRMGDMFETIEVDARNPYFRKEAIWDTETYPLKKAILPEGRIDYQYRGQLDETSYLPKDAYTVNIEGNGKDLREARFSSRRQIFLWVSCSSANHWGSPLREVFPSPQDKLFFGTNSVLDGSLKYLTIFVAALTKQPSSSANVLSDIRLANSSFTTF